MKAYLAGLQNSLQTSYANNGKTTLLGRAYQKTINSQTVLGPSLTQFIDVFTQVGVAPSLSYFNPTTGHLYVLSAASATPTVMLFTFSATTGAYAYVGKIQVNISNAAATTHVFRGFRVYENGGTVVVVISTTGSVVINGGTFIANGLSTADFTVGGTTIFAASGAGQKAVYFLQDPATLGLLNPLTTSGGVTVPQASTNAGINTKVYAQNGTAATLSIYSWDLATSPSVSGTVSAGINAQTTPFAGTAPSAYFSMGASQNGYSTTNPTAAAFEAVVFQGTTPTGITAWASGTAQVAASNVYFIRDLQLVSGVWYFNVASTAAGAAIIPTGAASAFTLMRAFGISSNQFNFKTGTLPALAGTILQANSFDYTKPTTTPANPALGGNDCIALGTSTTVYLGKISDLASLSGTWASLTPVTLVGLTAITAPTATAVCYSGLIDKWIILSSLSTIFVIPHQASVITAAWGGHITAYLEGLNPSTVQFGAATISDINVNNGWLFISSTTIGQRGCVFMDISSSAIFGNAAVISPVLNVPAGSIFKTVDDLAQLQGLTNLSYFWIRSAATSTDALFTTALAPSPSVTNGWTQISSMADLSATAIGPYFQLAITFQIITAPLTTPAQIYDAVYSIIGPNDISDNWVGGGLNTTQNNTTPAYTAFRLQQVYASVVPTLYFRAYDDSGNLVASANTVSNPTLFQYSTNNGTSWNALGTVPNTALTTEIRYIWASPPGVPVTCSIRES